jgi:hypothetical protein
LGMCIGVIWCIVCVGGTMEDGDRCLGGLCMWSDIRRVKNVCWRSVPLCRLTRRRSRVSSGGVRVRRVDDVRATCGSSFFFI